MNVYKVGLDIGSTTTKMVVLDKDGTTVLFSGYKRHQAKIQECLLGFLYQIKEQLGDIPLSFHITHGSSLHDNMVAKYLRVF
jgi:activator of 2-hydroxyglutaryl-CoA dehydratase